MTTTAADSTSIACRARACSAPASVRTLLYRWFSWWVNGYLEKHFHAVRLSRGTRPNVPPDLPLIVVLNHPSWWDPLIGRRACRAVPGTYPLRSDGCKGPRAVQSLRQAGLLRCRTGNPARGHRLSSRNDGDPFCPAAFRSVDHRPGRVHRSARPAYARLRPAIGHIARRLDQGLILTLALEYPFWEERLPEALARFGEPILIGRRRKLSARRMGRAHRGRPDRHAGRPEGRCPESRTLPRSRPC